MERAVRHRSCFAGWLALIAVLALALQGGVATAGVSAKSVTVEICSAHAGQTITLELPAAPSDKGECRKCPTCVAVFAVTLNPTLAVEPAVYAVVASRNADLANAAPLRARAPPRPPSQAPPVHPNA